MNLNHARTARFESLARSHQVDAHLGEVRRVAVFRALGLGDLLCATPALRVLRGRFPKAHISLIGLPWAAALAERLGSVDGFIAFPGHPALPERQPAPDAWPCFVAEMRAMQWDLAVQLHGSGRITNGLLAQWGARHVAAFHEPGLPAPDPMLGVPWPTQGSETHRLMKLIDALGAPDATEAAVEKPMTTPMTTPMAEAPEKWQLDFPLRPTDHEEAMRLLSAHGIEAGRGERRFVCVHVGSQLPSRRWPLSRFAEVVKALAEQGLVPVLTGIESERPLAEALLALLPKVRPEARPETDPGTEPVCINLVGQTSLWSMGALIQRAALLVCNDTGVSHVAAALGTPSVVISCGSDVSRWAPADAQRHRVLWADEPCRPCAHAECPYEHACAWDVTAASVLDAAQTQFAARA
jgi:ADP-heptose:LPS heptosyltransferase